MQNFNAYPLTIEQINNAFSTWFSAVGSGDAKAVMPLYAENAVLLPTLLGEVCATTESRRGYFDHFTAKRPQGSVDESHVRIYGNIAINSGHYTFAMDEEKAKARYTFVYGNTDKGPVIVAHHSSLLPDGHEKIPASESTARIMNNGISPSPIHEKDVTAALNAWLKDVASGSVNRVLNHYDQRSILLPTLEGRVCDSEAKRRHYFDHFLAKGPQGTVDELHVQTLGTIAVLGGHYTFGFKDGSSAKARFSYVYKNTPAGLMIVDHHSSVRPAGHQPETAPRPDVVHHDGRKAQLAKLAK
jgi:uncharacterized protein (TIGR02246 family)